VKNEMEYFPICITFSEQKIWATISDNLSTYFGEPVQIDSPSLLQGFFRLTWPKKFGKKKVVILFDEFQIVTASSEKKTLYECIEDDW